MRNVPWLSPQTGTVRQNHRARPKAAPDAADSESDVALGDMMVNEDFMKTLIASALMLIVPLGAHAACSATDFSVKDFRTEVTGGTMNRHVALSGELVNSCAAPAAAQLKVIAKDANGNVVASKSAWPAGTSNISPGKSVSFDLGRLIHYSPDMQSFAISIVSVRAW
jgi:hypothetical protein